MCRLLLPILERRWQARQGGNDLSLQRRSLLPASGNRPLSYSKRISSSVLPTIFLSNCNHIANKLDELHVLSTDASLQLDIISLTERWLDDFTPDSVSFA